METINFVLLVLMSFGASLRLYQAFTRPLGDYRPWLGCVGLAAGILAFFMGQTSFDLGCALLAIMVIATLLDLMLEDARQTQKPIQG